MYKQFSFVAVLHGGMDVLRTEEASRALTLCTCRGFGVEGGSAAVTHCTHLRGSAALRDAVIVQ